MPVTCQIHRPGLSINPGTAPRSACHHQPSHHATMARVQTDWLKCHQKNSPVILRAFSWLILYIRAAASTGQPSVFNGGKILADLARRFAPHAHEKRFTDLIHDRKNTPSPDLHRSKLTAYMLGQTHAVCMRLALFPGYRAAATTSLNS